MNVDRPSLAAIRAYLDEMMYALVDLRLSFDIERGPSGFPKFESLYQAVARLDPAHETLFRLLRLGEPVDAARVGALLPDRILRSFERTGLLVRAGAGQWQTSGLLVVPAEGLLLFVGVPPSYPTATGACSPWFDLSSYVMARALPIAFASERVLDVCSGSGLQALLAAVRGAGLVVGLELDDTAVEAARANAVINGLEERVEFRRSNVLSALADDERFDFVICNTPYAPVIEGLDPPRGLAALGNQVLLRLLERLPHHLSGQGRGILASWRAVGHRSSTYQMDAVVSQLERAGCSTLAFVDQAPDTAETVLRILRTDLDGRLGASADDVEDITGRVAALLQEAVPPVDGFYNQLIYFRRGTIEAAPSRTSFGLSAAPRPSRDRASSALDRVAAVTLGHHEDMP